MSSNGERLKRLSKKSSAIGLLVEGTLRMGFQKEEPSNRQSAISRLISQTVAINQAVMDNNSEKPEELMGAEEHESPQRKSFRKSCSPESESSVLVKVQMFEGKAKESGEGILIHPDLYRTKFENGNYGKNVKAIIEKYEANKRRKSGLFCRVPENDLAIKELGQDLSKDDQLNENRNAPSSAVDFPAEIKKKEDSRPNSSPPKQAHQSNCSFLWKNSSTDDEAGVDEMDALSSSDDGKMKRLSGERDSGSYEEADDDVTLRNSERETVLERNKWSNRTLRLKSAFSINSDDFVMVRNHKMRMSNDSAYNPSLYSEEDDLPHVDDFSSEDDHEPFEPWPMPFGFLKPLHQHFSNLTEQTEGKNRTSKQLPEMADNVASTINLIPKIGGQFWRDLPDVKSSGVLEDLSKDERKLQEAKFEILTSQASYVNSLKLLEKHYMKNINIMKLITKRDFNILFGHVCSVRESAQNFLIDLETHFQDDFMLKDICDILLKHANDSFKIYIQYASNYLCMTEHYQSLTNKNEKFKDAVKLMSNHQLSQNLPLESFLGLPMQRITRLPLLLGTVLRYLNKDDSSYPTAVLALETLKNIATECDNEIAKKRQCEEMLRLNQELHFPPEMRSLPLLTKSRFLVQRTDIKEFILRERNKKIVKLHLVLFNDLLVITKKDDHFYWVVDYCSREDIKIEHIEKLHLLGITELADSNPVVLTLTSNHNKERAEMIIAFDVHSERQRWLDVLTRKPEESVEETSEEEEINRKHVIVLSNYKALRPDDLNLAVGSIVLISKENDDWYHGERLTDGETGWFPVSCVTEIQDRATKIVNLKLKKELTENRKKMKVCLKWSHAGESTV